MPTSTAAFSPVDSSVSPARAARVIHTHLIKQANVKRADAASGAIALIQRFGSAANLNIDTQPLLSSSGLLFRHRGRGIMQSFRE